MAKRRYTTDNIRCYLQEFNLIWPDKIVYDTVTARYRKFKESDFRKKALILYLQNSSGNSFNAICEIDETKFIVTLGKQKLDDSQGWQDYLNEINSKVEP